MIIQKTSPSKCYYLNNRLILKSFIVSLIMILGPGSIVMGQDFNPGSYLWYEEPAKVWEEALPVGNGRLGAMVFGKTSEERIQLNEETYWSGGPYSTVVEGGYKVLPEIQKLIFEGKPLEAHKLFGRNLMGYPVEQMKYQSLANLHLFFEGHEEVKNYKRWLDLETATTCTQYEVDGIIYKREVFSSAPDQTIVVRITQEASNSNASQASNNSAGLNFRCQLRGVRNMAHSNYGTDYFRMDGVGNDGLMLNGRSADYLGVESKMKYRAQLKAVPEGGSMKVVGDQLYIEGARAVTLYIVAATNFVAYNDVSADPVSRVNKYLSNLNGKGFEEIKNASVSDYQSFYNRASLDLPPSDNSLLPTDKRMKGFETADDPNLAALAYNFGRYLLISSSRPGTQPANLQGIWNESQNPSWDSKYTTNINTEMNYWPGETANLSDCVEPLITMVKELTDQGSQVAKEHYGAKGWVFHQNTDLWRVAAPMDGPTWGTFTVGGAWLTTHLWEHYLYTLDEEYLKEVYPVIKGSVDFFMDFLVEHPNGKWLVTNPSNSPENPPQGPGYEYFYDEVTGMWYFTTICYGASMDMQILTDLFGYYASAARVLGIDSDYAEEVLSARARLVPPQVGSNGTLQEWTEDYEQLEKAHRHFSHMYGLYPGNVLSAKRTPELVDGIKAVLEQRGDGGTGFSRGWKMALWARLYDGERAHKIFKGYIKEQAYSQLFAKCFTPLQVDGTFGVTAGITEMIMQSHEGLIDLLPALPKTWNEGRFEGLCTRGAFELDMDWKDGEVTRVEVLSKKGQQCRINPGVKVKVTQDGKKVKVKKYDDGSIEFVTTAGGVYTILAEK